MAAAKGHPVAPLKHVEGRERAHGIPIKELGWSKAQVEEARRRLASIAEDWDDPSMDVYDEEP
ncbi:MAG: hypothetical protein L3K03_06545 [Thermoplasmata archaeon]|nr:hypothetical protein [Thermoplasmata archaeon]